MTNDGDGATLLPGLEEGKSFPVAMHVKGFFLEQKYPPRSHSIHHMRYVTDIHEDYTII